MFGFLGAAAFTMVFGIMVTKVGYAPLFVVLAIFDIIAAIIIWNVARPVAPAPRELDPAMGEPGSAGGLPAA
jgi:ACS family hexuronate transporter-like MFS transporter